MNRGRRLHPKEVSVSTRLVARLHACLAVAAGAALPVAAVDGQGATPTPAAVEDLGTLGGRESFASDVNAAGQVVGLAATGEGLYHAFARQDGAMTDLGTLGGDESWAEAFNVAGQVVGFARTDESLWRAALWSPS
jgi:probable HAF family extracellular repeat protein